MNVLQALTELYNSESMDSIYKEMARRILENLDQMNKVTIYDVAEITDASRTTVWRLVQKLGYSSFSDFRYAIQSVSMHYSFYNRMSASIDSSSSAGMISTVSKQLTAANKLFKEYITPDLIDDLTDSLSDATRIHFYMPFRSSFIYSFQQNLWSDGKNTEYCCMIPEMLKAADYLDPDSIVIMSTIEFTETQDVTEVIRKIKAKGSSLWITGNADSSYSAQAERLLLVANSDPASWLISFEAFILALSERYRGKYIDMKR